MKKIFRENVFVCEDFSLNRKENKLHRKYKVFGGSTENDMALPILEIEQNGWFHWIQHDSECTILSFFHLSLKLNFIKIFEHRVNFSLKKCNFINLFLKKLPLNMSFEMELDTHFIPLQNENSPILVGPKLREPYSFECPKISLFRRVVVT